MILPFSHGLPEAVPGVPVPRAADGACTAEDGSIGPWFRRRTQELPACAPLNRFTDDRGRPGGKNSRRERPL